MVRSFLQISLPGVLNQKASCAPFVMNPLMSDRVVELKQTAMPEMKLRKGCAAEIISHQRLKFWRRTSAKIRVCQRRAARNWANVEAGRCKQKHATSLQVGESGAAAHASSLLIAARSTPSPSLGRSHCHSRAGRVEGKVHFRPEPPPSVG
jgi:hypothetical protein